MACMGTVPRGTWPVEHREKVTLESTLWVTMIPFLHEHGFLCAPIGATRLNWNVSHEMCNLKWCNSKLVETKSSKVMPYTATVHVVAPHSNGKDPWAILQCSNCVSNVSFSMAKQISTKGIFGTKLDHGPTRSSKRSNYRAIDQIIFQGRTIPNTSMRVNCVDTSTTIPFRSDVLISNLLLGKSKVIFLF